LFDNLQNLIENNPNFAQNSLTNNSESCNEANKNLNLVRNESCFSPTSIHSPSEIFYHEQIETPQSIKQEQHLEDQLEELSRIKLEDIDELNSYMSTEDPKELNSTNSRQSPGNFVTNLFKMGFSNKNKDNYGANGAKLPILETDKPSKLKTEIENNAMLNVDFNDELMISLINNTKKSEINNNNTDDPNINHIMNFQMRPYDVISKFDDLDKPPTDHATDIDTMNLVTIDTSNSVDAIQVNLSYQLDQIQQQSMNLENFAENNEFFLDTDIILNENSNHGETKSK